MSTISPAARQELVTAVAERYQHSTAAEKGWILDEFVALTGYHRKHAIRVLNGRATMPTVPRGRRCVYDEAVTKGLIVLWEASDRMCGERRDHRPPSGTGAGRDCGSAPTSPFTPGRRARERAGAHLRRLEGPCAGLRRGQPRRALRQDDGRQCRLDAGAHRYRQRLDGVCAAARARSAAGGRRGGPASRCTPVYVAGDRHRQRQRPRGVPARYGRRTVLASDRHDTGAPGGTRSRRPGPASCSGWKPNRIGRRRSCSSVCDGSTQGCSRRGHEERALRGSKRESRRQVVGTIFVRHGR